MDIESQRHINWKINTALDFLTTENFPQTRAHSPGVQRKLFTRKHMKKKPKINFIICSMIVEERRWANKVQSSSAA